MIQLIVGHRGVGKTSFLKRIKSYYQDLHLTCQIYDLDEEIEKHIGRSIADIFSQEGEVAFRKIEVEVLNTLVNEIRQLSGAKFIALGAGYLGQLPENCQVIWLRRDTDKNGRIFVDRPRLDNEITPLAEFMNRFDIREARYAQMCHKEITLSEGWETPSAAESILLGLRPADLKASVTVLPDHTSSSERFATELQSWLQMGIKHIELRDDLLSDETIEKLVGQIPHDKILMSFRRIDTSAKLLKMSGSLNTDWALELGPSPFQHNYILSLHSRSKDETIDEAAERLLSHKAEHHKLAVPVHDFVELWSGHKFMLEDQEQRSFLPCSKNGRWKWYRLLQKNKMKINFIRTGRGSGPDQPTFFDYIQCPEKALGFAAVLGDPVSHSHTPAEHYSFFNEKKMIVTSVQMNEEECNQLNLSILDRMGLKAAAVTSPLKTKMLQVCSHVNPQAESLGAVNTIVRTQVGWSGVNTDIVGLRAIFSNLDLADEIVVWGGGGTRVALKTILPNAHFYSARRGKEIWNREAKSIQPEAVVWALGRMRFENTARVPEEWRPKYVFDLNYSEDSPGLEYALKTGAKYISGKAMFKSQAQAQREYWLEKINL